MFPGFKSPIIGLKQTNAGNSLNIPYGSAVGRVCDVKLETTQNNLVIGSGWGFTNATDSGNIIIGVSDAPSLTATSNITVTGSNSVFIGNMQGSSTTSWANNSWVQIGSMATGATSPGSGSVSVGIGRAIGTYGVSIGNGYVANILGGTAIGYASQVNNNYNVAIGYGAQTTGNNSICIGQQAINKANSLIMGATGFQNAVGDHPGQITFNTGYWASTTSGLATYCVGENLIAMYMQTTSNTATELAMAADGSSTPTNFIAMPTYSAWTFDLTVSGTTAATLANTYSANVRFTVTKGATAASTALVSAAVITTIADNVSGAWSVAVTADTTNGRPAIKVTGSSSTTVRWVATGRITKIGA